MGAITHLGEFLHGCSQCGKKPDDRLHIGAWGKSNVHDESEKKIARIWRTHDWLMSLDIIAGAALVVLAALSMNNILPMAAGVNQTAFNYCAMAIGVVNLGFGVHKVFQTAVLTKLPFGEKKAQA